MQSLRKLSWRSRFAADGWKRDDQRQQLRDIVIIRRCHFGGQWNAFRIGQHMMLATGFAAIGRVRSGLRPPKTARTEVESITARDQSIRSAARKYVSNCR